MFPLIVYIDIIHILLIRIILCARLLLLNTNPEILFKPYHDIEKGRSPLLQFDLLLMYLRNCENLRFLLLRYILYYHNGELIRGKIIFLPILKHYQEPLLTQELFHPTSQLPPHPPQTSCPYLLLQLTHLGFNYRPHHNIPPPPIFLCGREYL